MAVTVLPDDQVENISRPLANFIKSGATVALVVPKRVAVGTAKLGAKAVKGVIKPAVSPTKQFASTLLSPSRAVSEGFGDVPILNEITALFTGLASSFASAGTSAAKSLGGKIKSKISGFGKPKGGGGGLSDGITGNEVPEETSLKRIGDDVEKIRKMGEVGVKKEKKDEKLERKQAAFARFMGIEEDLEARKRRMKDARRAFTLAKMSKKTGFAEDRGALLDILGGMKLEAGSAMLRGLGGLLGIKFLWSILSNFVKGVILLPFRLLFGLNLWTGKSMRPLGMKAMQTGLIAKWGINAQTYAGGVAKSAGILKTMHRLGGAIFGIAVGGVFGYLKKEEWKTEGWSSAIGGALGGVMEPGSGWNMAGQMMALGITGMKLGAISGPVGAVAGLILGMAAGAALSTIGGEQIAKDLETLWTDWKDNLILTIKSMLPDFLAERYTAETSWDEKGEPIPERMVERMALARLRAGDMRPKEDIKEEIRKAHSPDRAAGIQAAPDPGSMKRAIETIDPYNWLNAFFEETAPEAFDYKTANLMKLIAHGSPRQWGERYKFRMGGDPVEWDKKRGRMEHRRELETALEKISNQSIDASTFATHEIMAQILKLLAAQKAISNLPAGANVIDGSSTAVTNMFDSSSHGTNIIGVGGNNNTDIDSASLGPQ